ncbi:MAG: heavy metal translocating P-type ATPase [Thermosphaera sp.]
MVVSADSPGHELRRERFRLIGVDCAACIYSIRRSLERLDGVVGFEADVNSGDAVVVYNAQSLSTRDIVKAIRDVGYDVEKRQLRLSIDLEEAEIPAFEKHVSRINGVIECRYSPITKVAVILFNPYTLSEAELFDEVKAEYPGLREVSEEAAEILGDDKSAEHVRRLVSFVAGLTAVIYHGLMALGVETPFHHYDAYFLFTLATLVIMLNLDILWKGLKSLARWTPTMDSLVSLSSLTTYLYSTAVLVLLGGGGEVFFEASAGVLGFVAAGRYLEERLRRRASRALSHLVELSSRTARVVDGTGSVRVVDIGFVKPGDIIEVRAGERIPVDGVVVEGEGYVDESMFTGEPAPKAKDSELRDAVLAGSFLVSGYIRVRATRIGDDTNLAHIVKAVREAQFYKPSIQRIADRVVGFMTWAVILLSSITFAYWFIVEKLPVGESLLFAVSVLAVTCPCPLGIAIPMVVSLASIKATQIGVLIRRGDVLERVLQVNVAVLDKTGTLTVGKPEVLSFTPLNGYDQKTVLENACSAELRSEHPLGKAILDYCSTHQVRLREVSEYDQIPGLGIVARLDDVDVAVGSERLFERLYDNGLDEFSSLIDEVSSRGRTPVVVALNGVPAGVFEIGDKLRPESKEFIRFLKETGIRPVLATGDNEKTAKVVSSELGIETVHAELRPEDKAELVEMLQSSGNRVMFVGDGVNDAASIGRAFVGVAMGRGSDLSKEAGDVVIVNDNLSSLIKLFQLSRKSRRKSMENLAWAFAYNLVLVPIAMGALYKTFGLMLRPEAAAVAMMLSDISVVLNSLSLLKWKPS